MMTIRGFTMTQLTEAAAYLKTAEGVQRRDALIEKAKEQKGPAPRRTREQKGYVTPQEFWEKLQKAQMALKHKHGDNWHLQPSLYRWATVPKKFRSIKSKFMSHKMPQDIKVPLNHYWPEQVIPGIGLIYAGKA